MASGDGESVVADGGAVVTASYFWFGHVWRWIHFDCGVDGDREIGKVDTGNENGIISR